MKLTPRQKNFCEYYLQTGNAAEAARLAGYSEKTARVTADSNEVLRFYSAVMRGEVKDQFGLDASLSDRLKAGDSLMKRYAAGDRSQDAMERLDGLLKEFRDAVKSETD